MDHVTPHVRSEIMRKVKSKDTKPELVVRRTVHAMGFRYRLHRKDLPGRPDLIFPRLRKVIFVHGCFWHRHSCCRWTTAPKTRKEFWTSKFDTNVERDRQNMMALRESGWDVEVIWQCETFDIEALRSRLLAFLKR